MEFPGIIFDTSAFKELASPDREKVYDLLIIGGGPAAMSAAIYAARKTLDTAILTRDFGGQIRETYEVENYLGFQSINALELASMFEGHVKSFDIPVSLGVNVRDIVKKETGFTVTMEDGRSFSGKAIIFAAGESHRALNAQGEKEFAGRGVTYCSTCDAPLFKGKRVVVAGGGNSGFTAALDLSRVNSEVTIVNFVEGWQADGILRKRLQSHDKISYLDFHQIMRIEGKENVESVIVKDRRSGEERRILSDGVFVEIGLTPNSGPLKGLALLNELAEVVVDCHCRTSVKGLFAAGDVTNVPHKQIIISAGEGAKAALSAYDYLVRTSQI